MLKERAIDRFWVEQTMSEPEKVENTPEGTRHFLRRIPEHGNRWLRVIVNIICRASQDDYRIFRPANERNIMRIKVDKEADALYFRLDEQAIVESEEVRPGVILDFDDKEQVVGVEFLNISKRTSVEELSSLAFQTE